MQFRKYFFRSSDSDSREIFFAEDSLVVLGRNIEPMFEGGFDNFKLDDFEFYRQDFEAYGDAARAFRTQCGKLIKGGYYETADTFAADSLAAGLLPKPYWQKALDEAVLIWADNHADEQLKAALAALPQMPPEGEPLALFLRAYQAKRTKSPDWIERARAARAAADARVKASEDTYTWSIPQTDIRAEIMTLAGEADLQKGDGAAALRALTLSLDLRPNHHAAYLWAWTIINYFPQRQEDAFDRIYPYLTSGYLPAAAMPEIVDRPAFKQYEARRRQLQKTGTYVHRWSEGGPPASVEAITAVERELDCTFPDDYRTFLREHGECDLIVQGPDDTYSLHVVAPEMLRESRDNILRFITMTESIDIAEAAFQSEYGVSLKKLVPVAAPTAASNCVYLHTGQGPKYGYCFTWNHDGAFELTYEHPSFAAYMDALMKGIDAKDPVALDLFNISVEDE